MKQLRKRLLAFVLAFTMIVTGLPMNTTTATAEDVSFILDFGMPTQGLNGSDVTSSGGMVGTGASAAITYGVSTSLAGSNWVLNPSMTTVAKADDSTYVNGKSFEGGVQYHKGKASNASAYFQTTRIGVRLGCGQTMAFDFIAPEGGIYEMQVYYSQPSKASSVSINPGTEYAAEFVDLIPSSGSEGKAELKTVSLTAGTNTITFFGTGTSSYTAFRAAAFTKVADLPGGEPTVAPTEAPTVEPTSVPTEEPTLAPTEVPTLAPTEAPISGVYTLDFGMPTQGLNGGDVTSTGGMVPTGTSAAITYGVSTSLAGTNWVLNPSKTTIKKEDANTYVNDTGFESGVRYHKAKNSNASAYFDTTRIGVRLGCGQTMAFDFEIAESGLYEMQVYYSQPNKAASVSVNPGSRYAVEFVDLIPSSGSEGEAEIKNVVLTAGTNTITFFGTGTSSYTAFRAVTFKWIGDMSAVPTPAPTPVPTPLPTLAPTTTPMPTEEPNAVKEPFEVNISTLEKDTAYTENDKEFYFTFNSKGANWAIDSTDKTIGAVHSSGNARIYTSAGVPDRVTLYKLNRAQVLSFTAPASGYYDLSALIYLHEEGGYADVYVNGEYVGTVNSLIGNSAEQKMLGVYLKGGELQNKVSIIPTGTSGGSGYKSYWRGFSFSTPATIASLTGVEIDTETTLMYVSDTQTVVGHGALTNGGLYRFSSVGKAVAYESSDPTVATVANDGKVTALKAGTTTITAIVPELGYTNTVEITVCDLVYDTPEINIKEGQDFTEGDAYTLEPKAKFNSGKYAEASKMTTTYESSDESVAKIEDGVLYAVAPGNAKITAYITYEGVTLDVSKNIIVDPYVPPSAFDIVIKGAKNLVISEDGYPYLSKDSYGTNWTVSKKTTTGILGTSETSPGNCRIFSGTYLTYLSLYKKGATFAFEIDVDSPGMYDITANMMKHTSGGLGIVYVNDVYVGTVDAYAPETDDFNVSKQPLLGVELKKGLNTIAVKTIGPSNGSKYYTIFTGFSFTTPDNTATISTIDAKADVENMYVGRKEQISVDALLTNNGRYEFEYSSEKFTYESSDTSVAMVSSTGLITGVGAGEVTITVTAVNNGLQDTLTFDVSDAAFDKVEMNVMDGETFYVASERLLEVVATLEDGTVISNNDLSVVYASSDECIAKIEDGVLKTVAKGNAMITAKATFTVNGTVQQDVKNIVATTIPLKSITANTAKTVVQELDKNGVQLIVKGVAEDDTVIEDLVTAGFTNFDYTYTSLNPELLRIDANGICYYVGRGVANVQIDAVIDGVRFSNVVEVVSSSAKTGGTLFTDDMVENARFNAHHYKWAAKTVKSLAGRAYQYVYFMDDIYNLIPTEGVPRSKTAGTNDASDYVKFCCPNCGINVTQEFGDWKSDPLKKPWKIWCPNCYVEYPTNDFGLLYKRGLDENGFYNRELAYQRNAEAVARGEKDALVNELYPEKGATWMVDDGFGWSPNAETYGSPDMIQRAFVAKYMYMLWSGGTNSLISMIDSLYQYYLYTGDERFGRAGVILLDRIADVHPDYDVTKVGLNYHASDGGGNAGYILGSIAEANFSETLLEAYDAFYPMYDDPEVIAYLSSKASELGLENPKTSGNLIRENAENGIVRKIIEGLYNGKVCGNFGYHQTTGTMAAIALDTQPETNDTFRWLLAPSILSKNTVVDPIFGQSYSCRSGNTGGELATKFVNVIDRDGFGAEVSTSYNQIWLRSVRIAEYLENYSTDVIDLYNTDPKFVNMLETFIFLTAGDGYTLQPGDGGDANSGELNTNYADDALRMWKVTKDPVAAQLYYLYTGGNLTSDAMGMFENIKERALEIQAVIDEYGEYKLFSHNLTGYGLAIVRGGKAGTKEIQYETRYDTWMYYGRTSESHAHRDMLGMGIDAYGFNFMPDLGAPAFKSDSANRVEWINNTLSHNTVVVNERKQDGLYTGTPLHFDSTENVKLIDTEANNAYEETDIYRRTSVTISANEDVAYTLDFFRVKGGNQHTYSFHTTSYRHYYTEDIELVPQVNGKGEYVGTYAGPDVPYGPDPNSTDAHASAEPMYPQGYTWLDYVNRGVDKTGDGLFKVKFEQTDFKNQVINSAGLAINVHALNDWTADSVDIMVGYPSPSKVNLEIPGYDYMLIQRKGENLDTLFTTLLEPYKVHPYIYSAEPISATIVDGAEGKDDIVKVVKVTLINGRTDYVIYATNKDVIYNVTDGNVNFNFKGFIGVYTVDHLGDNIYTYVNDGTLIGNTTSVGSYTGTVVGFTKEYVMDDYIYIKPEQTIEDLSVLKNQYIYIDNGAAKCNAVYKILSAEQQGENIALYLGNCSLIERYIDDYDLSAGFIYTISDGQSFEIPVPMSTGETFRGTNRTAGLGGSTSASLESSVSANNVQEEGALEITEEMLEQFFVENNPEEPKDVESLEKVEEPSIDEVQQEPSATPDVAQTNTAGGKKVRNLLLGSLGGLALVAGIFLILLGKKKEEDEN